MGDKGLFLFICLLPAAYAGPNIVKWQAEGGSRVFFVETDELPIVDIKVLFDAGSVRDPDEMGGLALLTNGLLDQGAGGLDANQISDQFERTGAVYRASAGLDSASVSLRSLTDRQALQPALANLARVLASPDFPDQAVARQKKRLLTALEAKRQSPGAIARDNFFAAIYKAHPYARAKEGTETSIEAISRADIIGFHRRYYTANNALVAIVGALSRTEAEAVAGRLTANLPQGERPAPLAAVSGLAAGDEIRISHPSSQVHVLLGQPGMARTEADYFPLYVGNHVLGGSGMVSRLFEEVRNQHGLSYSVYSYFSPRREKGPFVAGLQTRAEQQQEALQLLRTLITQYTRVGPTEAELRASKLNITGGFPLRLDSNAKILDYVATIGFYGLPLDYLDTYVDQVNAVTVEQIKRAFAEHIDPDKLVAVLVGPSDNNGNNNGNNSRADDKQERP